MVPQTKSFTTSVARVRFSADTMAANCLKCDAALEIHQPDTSCPERFLGACPSCGSWFYLSCTPDMNEALIVLLPNFADVPPAPVAGSPPTDA